MKEKKILAMTKGILVVFWSSGIIYILVGSGPVNPLQPPREVRQNLIAIIPQGWAFFTRNPREAIDHIYKKVGTEWVYFSYTNSSFRNFFGIKREARALNVELAGLLSYISKEKWKACEIGLNTFLRDSTLEAIRLDNESTIKSLCGDILIERRQSVPWAWSKSSDSIQMPSKLIQLNVVCK